MPCYCIFICAQLNFAKFQQQLKGLQKTTTNIRVVGFTDADTYDEVLDKGAKGLGVKCERSLLSLICSNGIIPNAPIHDLPWSLGEYVKYNGGTQIEAKKCGVCSYPTMMMKIILQHVTR